MKVLMMMWNETDASAGTEADIVPWAEFEKDARAAGVAVENGALEPPAAAKLVRPELGEPPPGQEVVDGTFSPGEAQVQAFYLLDCADLDAAIEWAKRLPTRGTVEVRALLEYAVT